MPSESKHTLGTFEHALENLRNNAMLMASQTERSLNRALKGLMERDDEVAALAIADDEEIDQLEKQIDKEGIELLLRFQPVASDLRRVISAMKLSSNLERVADRFDDRPIGQPERARERPGESSDESRVFPVSEQDVVRQLTLLSGNAARNRRDSAR